MTAGDFNFSVGSIVGFHALGGEVKIRPSTNNPDLLLGLKTVRVNSDILKIRSIRIDRKMLLLSFAGYPDRTSVEKFDGASVFCKESELKPLPRGEFWIKDLVGVSVFTTEGKYVGKVVSIIYGGNDLLEIQRESDDKGKTILVPFVQELVPTIDLNNEKIEVVDLPGLLEPQ